MYNTKEESKGKHMSVQCHFHEKKILILTENADGDLFTLEADDYNELVNLWRSDFCWAPKGSSKVYFASYCGRPISPYAYNDFLSLMQYISRECCHKWEME